MTGTEVPTRVPTWPGWVALTLVPGAGWLRVRYGWPPLWVPGALGALALAYPGPRALATLPLRARPEPDSPDPDVLAPADAGAGGPARRRVHVRVPGWVWAAAAGVCVPAGVLVWVGARVAERPSAVPVGLVLVGAAVLLGAVSLIFLRRPHARAGSLTALSSGGGVRGLRRWRADLPASWDAGVVAAKLTRVHPQTHAVLGVAEMVGRPVPTTGGAVWGVDARPAGLLHEDVAAATGHLRRALDAEVVLVEPAGGRPSAMFVTAYREHPFGGGRDRIVSWRSLRPVTGRDWSVIPVGETAYADLTGTGPGTWSRDLAARSRRWGAAARELSRPGVPAGTEGGTWSRDPARDQPGTSPGTGSGTGPGTARESRWSRSRDALAARPVLSGRPALFSARGSTLVVAVGDAGKSGGVRAYLRGLLVQGIPFELSLIDNGGDFGGLREAAEATGGRYVRTAAEGLELQREIDGRLEDRMARIGLDHEHHPTPAEPVLLLVVGEWLDYTASGRRAGESGELAERLVRRHRKTSGVLLTTAQLAQQAELGVIRDAFHHRCVLRVEQDGQVDLALGKDSLKRGALAHLIPAESQGVAYARDLRSGWPFLFRFAWVPQQDTGAALVEPMLAMAERMPGNARVIPGEVITDERGVT